MSARRRRWILGLVGMLLMTGLLLWWRPWSRSPEPGTEVGYVEETVGPDEPWPVMRPSPLDRPDGRYIPAQECSSGQPEEVVAVLGSPRGRHARGILCTACSPDGSTRIRLPHCCATSRAVESRRPAGRGPLEPTGAERLMIPTMARQGDTPAEIAHILRGLP